MPYINSGSSGTPPGFQFGYDQITAPVNVVSTTEATGTTVITCAPHTFDGAPVLAHFFAPEATLPSTAANTLACSLFEGATQLGRLTWSASNLSAEQINMPLSGFLRFTPTVGSHTYTVTCFVSATNGTPQVNAGVGGTATFVPAFIRFTKV